MVIWSMNQESKYSRQYVKTNLILHMWGFSCSHVQMWELDHKEGWALKNWCFRTVVLKKTLESPLDCKEIKPVIPKGNQPWIFTGRTDAEPEAPVLWPPDAKRWLTTKDPGGEAGDRGWDGWMASPTQQTWVWANSRRWRKTGKTSVLQSMGSKRVRLSDGTAARAVHTIY